MMEAWNTCTIQGTHSNLPWKMVIQSGEATIIYHIMSLQCQMDNEHVVFLIDIGTIHNFVSKKVPQKVDVKKKELWVFDVTMGDGTKLQSQLMHPTDVDLKIQNTSFSIDLHALPISVVDVFLEVLG